MKIKLGNLLLFQIIQITVLVIFVVFISDIRVKAQSNSLINRKLLLILKLVYLVPLSLYVYSICILSYVSVIDLVALSITMLGTVFVVLAKVNLADKHTWTGYCMHNNCFVADGVYAYIRHPIYAGIYVFIIGAALTMVFHTPMTLNAIALASLFYIMPFLAIAAKKETNFLAQKHGDNFRRYQRSVHPFIPIRKYRL